MYYQTLNCKGHEMFIILDNVSYKSSTVLLTHAWVTSLSYWRFWLESVAEIGDWRHLWRVYGAWMFRKWTVEGMQYSAGILKVSQCKIRTKNGQLLGFNGLKYVVPSLARSFILCVWGVILFEIRSREKYNFSFLVYFWATMHFYVKRGNRDFTYWNLSWSSPSS